MFSWNNLPKPIIALSPMADMSDSPFCIVAKELGAEVMFREMVSSEAIVRNSEKTLRMAAFDERERPLIQQLFGGNARTMAEAAAIIEERYHPDGFDINMGCPVYKIVSNFNGSALMRDPVRAAEIVREMKKVIRGPLSVKIRLGWKEKTDCLEFAKRLEEAGADLITVHGRTKEQGYSGVADWEMIGEVKKQVSIPVLCNGDIHKPELVKKALEISGCDGVLIARGCLGNPWFFKQAREYLEFGEIKTVVDIHERIRVMKRHAQLHVEHYGERGMHTFRKHISWYLKPLLVPKELKEKFMRVVSLAEFDGWCEELRLSAVER